MKRKRRLKHCNVCQYEWLTEIDHPSQCPHCRSTRWSRPAKELAGSIGKRGRPRKEKR